MPFPGMNSSTSQSLYSAVPPGSSTSFLTKDPPTAESLEDQVSLAPAPLGDLPEEAASSESPIPKSQPLPVPQRRTTQFNLDDTALPERAPRRAQTKRQSTQSARSMRSVLSTASVRNLAVRVKSQLGDHLRPERPVGEAPTLWRGILAILRASYLNILLLCIPVSWALHFAKLNDTGIFVTAFLAIIPLAKLLAFATDEMSMRVGQTLAGLLNATLGNAVELIVAIIALVQCELQVVQSSLIGSILSNLLLVLGMCFFAGGTMFSEQGFGISATQLNSSLLIMSVIGVLLPAAFHFTAGDYIADPTEIKEILSVSHGAAIILLFVYACYIVFQLFSHKQLYEDSNAEIMKSRKYEGVENPFKEPLRKLHFRRKHDKNVDPEAPVPSSTVVGEEIPRSASPETTETQLPEEEEPETPSMSFPLTLGLLVVVTVLVAVTAEFLVDSINGLTESGGISKEFVGMILLPIVGNAAEHVTAVTSSMKDKITLSLGVAVGSSIQIALFVIPFIVTLGWWIDKPLTLLFDPFESIVLFLTVILVNYTVADGRSNWLEGMILMCLYVMLAVVFWYYPGDNPLSNVTNC